MVLVCGVFVFTEISYFVFFLMFSATSFLKSTFKNEITESK